MPSVVIVGAGFAGLYAARELGRMPVNVTITDRKNHHTFQPLLYQVATAGLSPGDIAMPVRSILRRNRNTEVLLAEAVGFDLDKKIVRFREVDLPYDYLILATGAQHSYFAHPEWERFAPGLKTIEDAIEIRRRILLAFERAERQQVAMGKHDPINFVIVGAGPTGVELAGAIAEISRRVLVHDFRNIDPASARVLLLESAPLTLTTYPEDLSISARKQLEHLGVEVRTGELVTGVEEHEVTLKSGERIAASVVLWAAGVKASSLAELLGAPLDRQGRVLVEQDCSIPGHHDVLVVGDLAHFKGPDGQPLPGVAPVAIQMGTAVAKNIERDLQGRPRKPFHYVDKGSMATIGRNAAVAFTGKLHMKGFIAWLAWLFVHIFFLIGFRNRVMVLLEWAWAYFRFEKAARLITGETEPS
ncbi:MAG TPA: NAD(P)/FAD-dependent oxidoreductase [Terriglobales bacterium]|nr:NAD(P)/FAD-dependent oxidoreductase [Terriglobales bacterium]